MFVLSTFTAALVLPQSPASAQSYADPSFHSPTAFARIAPQTEDARDLGGSAEMPSHLRRHIVSYPTREAPGTIVIDTPNTYLYYVLGNGQAVRYGIGVGRDGFRWSGTQRVARKAEWPDWRPPAEMVARQPYLPRFMAGGPSNPLGARALYLGNSIYRIHGTNAPSTIGGRVSSGCIRMLNEDVVDLYRRVKVGTKVVVLPDGGRRLRDIAQDAEPRPARQSSVRTPRQSVTVRVSQPVAAVRAPQPIVPQAAEPAAPRAAEPAERSPQSFAVERISATQPAARPVIYF